MAENFEIYFFVVFFYKIFKKYLKVPKVSANLSGQKEAGRDLTPRQSQ